MSGIEIGNLESLHTLVFSESWNFCFDILPLFLILFYAVPKRFRMFVLFAFSLILYALGDPVHVLILLGMSVVNWLFGYGLATERMQTAKKVSGASWKNCASGCEGASQENHKLERTAAFRGNRRSEERGAL